MSVSVYRRATHSCIHPCLVASRSLLSWSSLWSCWYSISCRLGLNHAVCHQRSLFFFTIYPLCRMYLIITSGKHRQAVAVRIFVFLLANADPIFCFALLFSFPAHWETLAHPCLIATRTIVLISGTMLVTKHQNKSSTIAPTNRGHIVCVSCLFLYVSPNTDEFCRCLCVFVCVCLS